MKLQIISPNWIIDGLSNLIRRKKNSEASPVLVSIGLVADNKCSRAACM